MIPHDVSTPEAGRSPLPSYRHDPQPTPPVVGRVGMPSAPPMTLANPQGAGSGPDLMSLLRGFKRRWLLAVTLGLLLAAVVAAGVWTMLDPPHIAFTQLHVKSRVPGVVSVDQGGRDEFNRYLKSQAALIRTREVLAAASNSTEVKNLNLEARHPDPVAWFEEQTKVDFQTDNEIVRVLLTWDNPDEARVIIRNITQEYLDRFVKNESAQRRTQAAQLDGLYTDKREELRQKKKDLDSRMQDNNIQALTPEEVEAKQQELLFNKGMAQSDLHRIASSLFLAQGELAAAEKQFEALKKNVPIPEAMLGDAAEADYKIRMIDGQLEKYEELRDQYKRSYGTNNSNYRIVLGRIRELTQERKERIEELKVEMRDRAEAKILAEQEAMIIGLKNKVSQLKAQKGILEGQLLSLVKSAKTIERDSSETEIAHNEILQMEHRLAELGHRRELAKMDILAGERVTFSGAVALEQRNHKKQVLATGLGFGSTFFAICLSVGWWEYRRRKVQSSSQVDEILGLPVVGSIPTSRRAEALITGEMGDTLEEELFLESIDSIRTSLLHLAQREDRRVLMISSAEEGEGKTILASHLANSLARAGRKTLLIDGDLRFPGLHTHYDLAAEPGLCDILMGESSTDDAIQATTVDGVMLLPAGQCDREVLQALARDGVQDVLAKLREEFDFIILDSHQVLGATDALLLGQNVDAVLMAVLRDVSHLPHVKAAAQRLQSVSIPVLGAVVNGLDPEEVYSNTVSYSTSAA